MVLYMWAIYLCLTRRLLQYMIKCVKLCKQIFTFFCLYLTKHCIGVLYGSVCVHTAMLIMRYKHCKNSVMQDFRHLKVKTKNECAIQNTEKGISTHLELILNSLQKVLEPHFPKSDLSNVCTEHEDSSVCKSQTNVVKVIWRFLWHSLCRSWFLMRACQNKLRDNHFWYFKLRQINTFAALPCATL